MCKDSGFFVQDQTVVKGEMILDALLSPVSPTTVCFYFIAGCLGYSAPAQSHTVGQTFVEKYFSKASLVGLPCPPGLLPRHDQA